MGIFFRSASAIAFSSVVALLLLPSAARADIILQLGMCTTAEGCNQSINFTPNQTAVMVVGDTNPAPVYNVFATSLDPNVLLNGNGSTLENGSDTPSSMFAMPSFSLAPQTGFLWSTIEFQLDELNSKQPLNSGGLTFTVLDQLGTTTTINTVLPWEGNSGENQHYTLTGQNGELIKMLTVSYTDPLAAGNGIQDMHNIDVATTTIPEPGTIGLLGVALLGFGLNRRNRHAKLT